MFNKQTQKGYKQAIPGIKMKTLAYGERTLMSEFLLTKGSVLPRHAHPYEQTGYLVKGRMLLMIGETEVDAAAGDSWCIPETVLHGARILEDSVAIEVFSPVREDYLPKERQVNGGPGGERIVTIAEIYRQLDRIGCLTFATIDGNAPQTRIAHFFAFDEEGLYFRTMTVKPFYAQLKKTGKVAICGMYPRTAVRHDAQGMPYFAPGYTIRATGDVREISLNELKQKAAVNGMFSLGVKDIEKYPAMTTFCLYSGWGEMFDFDFEMECRSHKLLRTGFCFGGASIPFRGVRITEECIACGLCREKCSFKAIDQEGERFVIDHTKCDVCGDCTIVCPVNAIEVVTGE